MTRLFRSPRTSYGLAAWLLATNLVLGIYHRHEPDRAARLPGPAPLASSHDANPNAWHYHLLLLGVELKWLSTNSETCPFGPDAPKQQEAHVLLAGQLGIGHDHETDGFDHALRRLTALPLLPLSTRPHGETILPRCPAAAPPDGVGSRRAEAVLGCRSGVQQV